MWPVSDPVAGDTVATAFSQQSAHFDLDDKSNPVLQAWRRRIYARAARWLQPGDRILELNAGTGIDAVHFAELGHYVHATDAAPGMIDQIKAKGSRRADARISCQQLPFERLNDVAGDGFNFIFSNFGGLNCIPDLSVVGRHLPGRLTPGAHVCWVLMPPVCPWEWLRLLRGQWTEGTRRLQRQGAVAHLEGKYFRTYYHSLRDVRRALGDRFSFKGSASLGVLSPPPAATRFVSHYPGLSRKLELWDEGIARLWPFNRWGDHIIVTFQFTG